ncbi:hypothetical protein LTR02_009812 [Friedmanniomyces endolithicus]|nr:hypothetical protein LTR94_022298 [Friedmanniomyces endolithicus]KAK0774221.1 hypothetical protein LTR75_016922 [Friedmanniomyces endolithicus]KAK0775433.1 hypothetical protein LTR38_015860 [Friedmanniomyces endolithicus]KAK0782798.1 hypothetical protein LTR59_012015 [Friedmanniomyces endolithicus]KAK0842340.1 hypothetical protein LTR03_009361 [Friedmanniomyces endolithicus]
MASSAPADSEDNSYVMVNPNVGHPTSSPDYFTAICAEVDNLSADLRTISLEIHDNPELQYKEFHAHKVLTEYLARKLGWTVTPSAYGIATAFVAVFDSGRKGAVVSFNAEYDALAGIGHACGHNLIAVMSVAGALATAKVMKDEGLAGKVMLFGTPAEEGGGGKIKLLKAGAYTNVDISLIAHPGISPDAALVRTAAYFAFKVEYFGKEAHAAVRPWEGINALDALITAYNAISVLRQQTEPGDIVQGMITDGGLRPNIIHAYSAGRFVVRSSSRARVEALKKRVFACFEAGAMATGAELKLTPGGSYADLAPNHALGRSYRKYFNCLGGDIVEGDLDILRSATSASTDQGDISYAIPSIQPSCWIRSEDRSGRQLGGPHTPDFEKAARTEEVHGLAMRVAKALAATAVDVLTRPELLAEVKREFDEMNCVDELTRRADCE